MAGMVAVAVLVLVLVLVLDGETLGVCVLWWLARQVRGWRRGVDAS